MTDTFMVVLGLLAEEPRDTGPEFGKASPFGLLIVVLLMVGTFVLIWSMNRHLKKLPESFDGDESEPDRAGEEGTVQPPTDPTKPESGG